MFSIKQLGEPYILQSSILLQQVYFETYGTHGIDLELAKYTNTHFNANTLKNEITDSNLKYYLAVKGENPIGILRLKYHSPCPIKNWTGPEVSRLYILNNFKRKQLGTSLLKEAENDFSSKGAQKYWLWVYEKNIAAIKFYTAYGFKVLGEAYQKIGPTKYRNIVMTKEIGC